MRPESASRTGYNHLQMQLGIESHIPDGLLAANALLAENSRQGVPTSTQALHPGFGLRISSTAMDFQFRCSEIVSGTVVAPNNGTPRTPSQCAGAALKKNAVALTLDAAGIGAGFLPGGELVVAGVQATISVASGVNSATHGDAGGSVLGVLGLPATFTGYAAKALGAGGRYLPYVGSIVSAAGAISDGYGAYQDYKACLAGG
jgi:hypothetical protein